jgi:transcriptional regulator with XRE-family HTH domain
MALTANGAAIKALRQAHGWKGTKFAIACGITHPHLFNVERGIRQASPEVLRKMADTLGVPLAAITSSFAVKDVA